MSRVIGDNAQEGPPFLVLRTPVLALQELFTVLQSDDVNRAVMTLLKGDVARQAVVTASASLDSALFGDSPSRAKRERALGKALAYITRMASRCTPFGMFAGVSVVGMSSDTDLQLLAESCRTTTRPDMAWLISLLTGLEAGPNRTMVRYSSNEAVVERGGRLYVAHLSKVNYSHHRTRQRAISLKNTSAVRAVRRMAQKPVAYGDIVTSLAMENGATEEKARSIVDSLIEAGVLLSEFRLSPLGTPAEVALESCERLDHGLARDLKAAISGIRQLDEVPVFQRSFSDWYDALSKFAALGNDALANCVQSDMYFPCRGGLGRNVVLDAVRLGEYLFRASPRLGLESLRKRFVERYEGTERIVPLMELADENLGLGSPEDPEPIGNRDARNGTLLRLISEALVSDGFNVELSDADFVEIVPEMSDSECLPSMDVAFQIAATRQADINVGRYEVIPSGFVGTTWAGASAGRFFHLFDNADRERLGDLIVACAENVYTTAELVYAPPNARSYNVLIRPRLLAKEIVVGVTEADDERNRLQLSDLWVGVESGLFFIWSKSLNKRVIVRENHVFNTIAGAPNLCRLLALAAQDGRRTIREFDWGPMADAPFLPRLSSGRIVLSRARWNLPAADLLASKSSADRAISRFRDQLALPRFVSLRQADNELLIDLESASATDLIASQIPRQAKSARLVEAIPPEKVWLSGPKGKHCAEFVLSWPRRSQTRALPSDPIRIVDSRARFGPGSRWVYAKLYVSPQALEELLTELVFPEIDRLKCDFQVDRWFFVRYADPQRHLRLRVRGSDSQRNAILPGLLALFEQWLQVRKFDRYSLDTFDPEYERYGGPERMDAVETFFSMDSNLIARSLKSIGRSADDRIGWAAASFARWVLGDRRLVALALRGLANGKEKLTMTDRVTLRAAAVEDDTGRALLSGALLGDLSGSRLASLYHLHCNRVGLSKSSELRATALLRSIVLSKSVRAGYNAKELA